MSDEAELMVDDLQGKVGYGHGTMFGYTEDGSVWVTIDTKDNDGRPMQTMVNITPERALQWSESLLKAA